MTGTDHPPLGRLTAARLERDLGGVGIGMFVLILVAACAVLVAVFLL